MPKYRVREGHTHGVKVKYQAGDVLDLSEAEAAPLLDKLEPVRGGEPVNVPKPAPAIDEGGEGTPADAPPVISGAPQAHDTFNPAQEDVYGSEAEAEKAEKGAPKRNH